MSKNLDEFAAEVTRSQEKAVLQVPVAADAHMNFPTAGLCWQARYAPQQLPTMLVASALDSYRYLVLECGKGEAWRRIKAIREYQRAAEVGGQHD